MIDKRTYRSQNYKFSQLQQHQKLSSSCEVLPPSKFDFTLADPAFGNIYEMLKVTHLYLCATQSPVSSTMFNIIQQFEQLAINTTSTVAKYAVQTKQLSLIVPIPSSSADNKQSDCNLLTTSADSKQSDCNLSTTSAPVLNSESIPADVTPGSFYALLESSADQLEINCSLLEQHIKLSSLIYDYKSNLSICETENLRLDSCLRQLQADSQLCHDSVIASHIAAITAFESDISHIHYENVQLRQAAPKYISGYGNGYGNGGYGGGSYLYYTESTYRPKTDFLAKLQADKGQVRWRDEHRVYR